jgi:hypothetical protein
MATREEKRALAKESHGAVEFVVAGAGRPSSYFSTFKEASAKAVEVAAANGDAVLDVIIHSEAGARWWGGDAAVDRYKDDPEASVFDRYIVTINYQGTIA